MSMSMMRSLDESATMPEVHVIKEAGSMKRLVGPREEIPRSLLRNIAVGKQIAQSQLKLQLQSGCLSQEALKHNSHKAILTVQEAVTMKLTQPGDMVKMAQETHGTLQRQMISTVVASEETNKRQRMHSRKEFLKDREARHEEIRQQYLKEKEVLQTECEKRYIEETEKLQKFCRASEIRCLTILAPVETDTADLGQQSQQFVQGLVDKLMEENNHRKEEVNQFQTNLTEIEAIRYNTSFQLLERICDEMTDLGNLVSGEVERWGESQLRPLNKVLIANSKSCLEEHERLTIQASQKRKELKCRWYAGLLLWKKKRHHNALEICIARISSREFEHPDTFHDVLIRIRSKQDAVFADRKQLIDDMYIVPVDELKSASVAMIEEQSNVLNERTQEEYDNLFVEVKELKNTTHHRGDSMLNQLRTELELYDAKSEWGEHDTVKSFVELEVAPKLNKVFLFFDALIDKVQEALETMDENQHHTSSRLILFGVKITSLVEKLKQSTADFEFNHQNEVESCLEEFEDQCTEYEKEMDTLHLQMNDAAHLPDLVFFQGKVFEHLEVIGQSYRTHANTLLAIFREHPQNIVDYFAKQTDLFSPHFGLARIQEEKVKEEETPKETVEVEEEEKPEQEQWREVQNYRFPLTMSLSIDEYRLQVVPSNTPAAEEKETAEKEGENEEAANEENIDEEISEDSFIPICADGNKALDFLKFGPETVDPAIMDLRRRVFTFIHENYDRIATKAKISLVNEEERISTVLNQRLRRHCNRQGTVQVEWFQPRKHEIEKHKIKFERHLISVAQKHAAHEDLFEEILNSVDGYVQAYVAKMDKIREKVKVAGSLNELSACERRARKDVLGGFQVQLAEICENLHNLATKAPADLEHQNRAFLQLCKASAVENPMLDTPVEMYSISEMEFYSGELDVLDKKLREKAKERQDELEEFNKRKEVLIYETFNSFQQYYDETQKYMVANQGLGLLGRKKKK